MIHLLATRRSIAAILLLPALLFAAGGCQILGYASKAAGPAPVDAQYLLHKAPTLVIVKDVPDPTGLSIESEEIAAGIEAGITAHELAPLIPAAKLSDYRTAHLDSASMSPAQLGKALGAEQVIFVQLTNNSVFSEGTQDIFKGKIGGTVRVIDPSTGHTVFPNDGTPGASVSYETPLLRRTDQNTPFSVQRNLNAGLADQVVKLFYKYKPE
jgi:hypothetical protein